MQLFDSKGKLCVKYPAVLRHRWAGPTQNTKKSLDGLVSCFESHNNDNDFFILFKPLTHCKKVCLILLGLVPCIILKLYRYCTVVVSKV